MRVEKQKVTFNFAAPGKKVRKRNEMLLLWYEDESKLAKLLTANTIRHFH